MSVRKLQPGTSSYLVNDKNKYFSQALQHSSNCHLSEVIVAHQHCLDRSRTSRLLWNRRSAHRCCFVLSGCPEENNKGNKSDERARTNTQRMEKGRKKYFTAGRSHSTWASRQLLRSGRSPRDWLFGGKVLSTNSLPLRRQLSFSWA